MLHVQEKRRVEDTRLGLGELFVRPEHAQDILRRRPSLGRPVDVHAAVVFVVVVGVVGVDRQHREHRDQHEALADDVGDVVAADVLVVGGQGQDASRHRVHDVDGSRLHDDVARKVPRQVAVSLEDLDELFCLVLVRQFAKEQEVSDLLKGEALIDIAVDQVIHTVVTVIEAAVGRDALAVFYLKSVDTGDRRKTREDTLAVGVAQAAVDAQVSKEMTWDRVVLFCHGSFAGGVFC